MKFNNWKDVGGEDRPIVRLSRETNSGTHVYFLETVIRLGNSKDKSIFSSDTLLLPSSEGIISEVRDNPNAIGYDGLGYITPEVKTVAVGKQAGGPYVMPSVETVNNKTYPVSRNLFMYTHGQPTAAVKDYLDWVGSAEARKIVSDLGFVPILKIVTRDLRMDRQLAKHEILITWIIRLTGYSSILFVTLIFFFLLREGLPALGDATLANLFSTTWYPIENYFGLLPLIFGSLIVTAGALLIAVPFGLLTAIYISEVASPAVKEFLKPLVEILAGLPSVVLGFLGILILVPFLRRFLDIPTGLTAFTGAILLGLIAIPTIVSISEDSLNTVPHSYREASLALGATQWQTIWHTTLPAARSGVLTAIMLGIGRAIGETMAVMMVTGNAPVMAHAFASIFMPARTMTATIASEMGEVASGSPHYHVLFFIGIVLFILSLGINIIVSSVSSQRRKRAERLLS